jgi:Uma2 family endonuclease
MSTVSTTPGIFTFSPSGALPDAQICPTMESLWVALGRIPLDRIQLHPLPGTATDDDAADSRDKFGVNCELIQGVLVAKPMGWYESNVALALAFYLELYLESHPLGVLAGEDGPVKTVFGNTQKPDISFVSFDRLPNRKIPRKKVLPLAPDLAVEVLSEGNTKAEMEIKLREYFAAGVRLVWYIDPESRSARVFTAVERCEEIPPTGLLNGGDVLPGFELSLARLFEKAGPRDEE